MTIYDTGKSGEVLAGSFLEQKGYILIERNWRIGRNEIDLIASFENTLIFVEVKTRLTEYFGYPEEAVDLRKQENIRKAAAAYLHSKRHHGETRFDVVSVILDEAGKAKSIFHIEDAFFSGS